VGNGVRQFFLEDNCPDTGCGIKVFRRIPYLELPMFNGQHRYLPALFQSLGFVTEYVPVNHRPRERGVSKYNNLQRGIVGIRDLVGVSWLRSRMIKVEAKEVVKS
jgi:dolichol-phosphate mannosyltransferase